MDRWKTTQALWVPMPWPRRQGMSPSREVIASAEPTARRKSRFRKARPGAAEVVSDAAATQAIPEIIGEDMNVCVVRNGQHQREHRWLLVESARGDGVQRARARAAERREGDSRRPQGRAAFEKVMQERASTRPST